MNPRTYLDGKFSFSFRSKILTYTKYACNFFTSIEEKFARQSAHWDSIRGSLKYQVSYQQVRNWTRRFEELGEAGLEDRRGRRKKDQTPRTELEQAQIEIEQLKHKLYLAEMERDLLKNWTRWRGEILFRSKTAPGLHGNQGMS